LGPKYSLIHLAIKLIQYDVSHDIHPIFAKSPNSLLFIGLVTSLLDPTVFVLFMVEIISFGTQILFLFDQIGCSSLFVQLVDVGVGDFA
jgi:hypothetical protein